MLKEILVGILILALIALSSILVYQLYPSSPLEFYLEELPADDLPEVYYGDTPVFMENLRFNHNNISYFIEPSCPDNRKSRMKEALEIFQNEVEIITFNEIMSEEADISIGCSDNYIDLGEDIFAAGEGGPSRIINTSHFKTIEKGKISLYKESKCEYPVVELHEISHVFGFDHTENKKSVMYPTAICGQRITKDMVDLLKTLYSIKPLPDAKIKEISAIKIGKYLDFNITISNEGLIDIGEINLTISTEGEEIEVFPLNELGIGYIRTLQVKNIPLPSRNINKISFIIDKEGSIEELNEENNFGQMLLDISKN
jgi:hypothetical protein|tara:strand:- start:95 stop:1036 length:942 start_codon:yes stop_codon:yes gene_type:complete